MAGKRQKPAEQLVNKRGGRARQTRVVERPPVAEIVAAPSASTPAAPVAVAAAETAVADLATSSASHGWLPDLPTEWGPGVPVHPDAMAAWEALRSSPWSRVIDLRVDAVALCRWIFHVSEAARLRVLAAQAPLMVGSTGQYRRSPLYDVVDYHEGQIGRGEDHFGLTPLARMRLGLAITEAHASAHDLRERLMSAVAAQGDRVRIGG